MAFDLTDISGRLMALTLEDISLSTFGRESIQMLTELDGFCHKPVCSLYLVHSQKRKLELIADNSCSMQDTDAINQRSSPDCFFFIAARSGETTVLNREKCAKECRCNCESNLHIVPLKKENITIAILAISLTEADSPSDEQLKVLQVISDILAKSIHRFVQSAKKDQMARLVHENPSPIIECDTDGNVLYANPTVKRILWHNTIDIDDLLPSNHIEYTRSAIRLHTHETVKCDLGSSTYSWSYHFIPEVQRVFLYGFDISEQRRIETQVAHNAMHDVLTDLPNRNHLLSVLNSEFSVIKRRGDYSFALLLVDLDRFKTVIESLGFEAGNQVLQEIALRLKAWRGNDSVVARLGGDEFAVIVEDVGDISCVVEIATQINGLISEPFYVNKNSISLTVSIGIAIGNSLSQTPEGVLQNASAAVYRAKRQGTNNTEVFDKEMHLNALARLQVHNELLQAMETGALMVYYQPVLGLNDLRIRGFEALARWQHPEKGLLGPGHFIPVAEETGLINELGAYVFRQVCKQLAVWKSNRLPLAWVSVNVSAHQFKLDHLVSDVMRYIVEAGADPARLFVEITEGTAAEQPERAFEMMTKLREHGIRIALDDFGTGYSSMSYLKRFPIDTLKLDRTFIMGLPENQDDAAIATTVINMAKSLGMKVVAEGVEDERQAMFLRLQKCDEVQGFLYGKPMPARNATSLLKAGSRARKDTQPIERIKLSQT